MNHSENVISLISVGRCGSSALESVLSRINGIKSAGETGEIIFDNREYLNIIISKINTELFESGFDAILTRITRQILAEVFGGTPDLRWLHKPTGLPECYVELLEGGADIAEISRRYWAAFDGAIPSGPIVTTLRDPCDNIMSISAYTQQPVDLAARYYFAMMHVISQCTQPVHAFNFNDLASRNEAAFRNLFAFVGAPFHNSYLSALDDEYAVNRLPASNTRSSSRKYRGLEEKITDTTVFSYIKRSYDICDHFGVHFQRPQFVLEARELEDCPNSILAAPSSANGSDEGTGNIRIMQAKLFRSEARGAALVQQVTAQRHWIEQQDRQLTDLKRWLDELQAGKDWLESMYHQSLRTSEI